MLQPMTLEADRGASTRSAMLDPSLQRDPKLCLEIGICGITKADGSEVLEVSLHTTQASQLSRRWLSRHCCIIVTMIEMRASQG